MMKLSHVFYCLLGCVMFSCYQIKPEQEKIKAEPIEETDQSDRRIEEVIHDGCVYLIFHDTNGISATGTYGGIVHKENCPNHTP